MTKFVEDGGAGLEGRATSTWKSCKNVDGLVGRVDRRSWGGLEDSGIDDSSGCGCERSGGSELDEIGVICGWERSD